MVAIQILPEMHDTLVENYQSYLGTIIISERWMEIFLGSKGYKVQIL